MIGIDIPTAAGGGADPVAAACRAERLGFDFVSASDHPADAHPSHETWTMLTWIAARTTRIRIATRVLGLPFRPPAIVAKMAATLADLSGGRLVLGLGAGASDPEIASLGLTERTPREKVDALDEAIQVIRGLWTRPGFTFSGAAFHVTRADLEPKPAQPIPIWLGTFGPRALSLTGRLADGWIPSYSYAPPETIPAMLDRIHTAAECAGRDPSAITRIYNVEVHVGDRVADVPGAVTGTPAAITEQLLGFLALGFDGVNLKVGGLDSPSAVELLAHEVLPALRAT